MAAYAWQDFAVSPQTNAMARREENYVELYLALKVPPN